MSSEPPPFQESSRCDVCKCSFSTFRRRHHCRRCGRTLCSEHSSDQMALPQFGIFSNVRVCAECFNDRPSTLGKNGVVASPSAVEAVSESISKLDFNSVPDIKPEVKSENLSTGVSDCKCGMPLCICEVPAPKNDTVILQPLRTISNPPLQNRLKGKKAESTPKSRGGSTSNSKSSLFTPGQVASSHVEVSSINYEVTGEGMREAIKNGDTAGAKRLLTQGVDANYLDKQGSSLLHLATVFNQTEIAFALIDHGAKLDCKNSQGETPIDCAPVTLQFKIQQKIEENMKVDPTPSVGEV